MTDGECGCDTRALCTRGSARRQPLDDAMLHIEPTRRTLSIVGTGRRTHTGSEREAFDMEVAARDAGQAQVGHDPVDHARGPADVDVALVDVGNELSEMAR